MTHPTERSPAQSAAFCAAAEQLPGIDREAYTAYGRDWRDPIIGLGPRDARLCLFGRDPGRTEVERARFFVGKAGLLVRAALQQHQREADVFWLNTVPYKPIRNRAWSMAAKRRFQAPMADLLLNTWQGHTASSAR